VPGNPGEFTWNGAYGTQFFCDPKERLVVVVGTAAPGRNAEILPGAGPGHRVWSDGAGSGCDCVAMRDAPRTVIASEAKQSILLRQERMDCFVRFAPHNDEVVAIPATNWHDGQITKSMSSPSRKNIPFAPPAKSVVQSARLTQLRAIAIVTNVRWDAVDADGRD